MDENFVYILQHVVPLIFNNRHLGGFQNMTVEFFHTYISDNGKYLKIIESAQAFPFVPQLFQIFGSDKNFLAIIP
jgi:hypothetical protein